MFFNFLSIQKNYAEITLSLTNRELSVVRTTVPKLGRILNMNTNATSRILYSVCMKQRKFVRYTDHVINLVPGYSCFQGLKYLFLNICIKIELNWYPMRILMKSNSSCERKAARCPPGSLLHCFSAMVKLSVKVCPWCGVGLLFSYLFFTRRAASYKITLLFGFGSSR